MAVLLWIFALCLACLSVSEAGEICARYGEATYCEHGCCDDAEGTCCPEINVAAIIGPSAGAVVVIAIIIIIILICRCRSHRGIVCRGQPGGTVIVQQGITNQAGYTTAGLQPGVYYPLHQGYAPQPGAIHTPYPQTVVGQPYLPQAPVPQGPPSYDSLSFPNQQQQGQQPGAILPPYPQTVVGQPYLPQAPVPQGPPSYDSLSFPNQQQQGQQQYPPQPQPQAVGGVVNQDFAGPQKQ